MSTSWDFAGGWSYRQRDDGGLIISCRNETLDSELISVFPAQSAAALDVQGLVGAHREVRCAVVLPSHIGAELADISLTLLLHPPASRQNPTEEPWGFRRSGDGTLRVHGPGGTIPPPDIITFLPTPASGIAQLPPDWMQIEATLVLPTSLADAFGGSAPAIVLRDPTQQGDVWL